jgi:hypothetical protein
MVDEKNKPNPNFRYNHDTEEFYDPSGWTVREKERENIKKRLEQLEKSSVEPGEKKKRSNVEEIEKDIDEKLYREATEEKRRKDLDLAKKRDAAQHEIENEIVEYAAASERGELNWAELEGKHPKLAKIKKGIKEIDNFLSQNVVSKKIQQKLNDIDDSYLIKNGVSIDDIAKYREYERKYETKKRFNDMEGAHDEESNMLSLRGKMNRVMLQNKHLSLEQKRKIAKEEAEISLLKRGLSGKSGRGLPVRKSITPKVPANVDYRNQGSRVRGVQLLGGPHTNVDPTGFRANGVNMTIRPGNVGLPRFIGYQPNRPQPQNEIEFARNRIAQKKIQKEYERQLAEAQRIQYENQVQNSVANERKRKQMLAQNGVLPESHTNRVPVRTSTSVRFGNLPTARIGAISVILPRPAINQRINGNKPVNRVPSIKNNFVGMKNPFQNKIHQNSMALIHPNISAIHSGIASVVSSTHRTGISRTGSKPVSNTPARDFGLSITVPKINIENQILIRKKKKGDKR